ncbi:MAG: undecaprenyl-phosphate glucose phosphotransferase [Anaerolineae bacterium]|nr:undecaprenyl-phosphate glucose phosphotransferase [Anaerolineae bacterium]
MAAPDDHDRPYLERWPTDLAGDLASQPLLGKRKRLRRALLLVQILIDCTMLVVALFLGYLSRSNIPVMGLPTDPPSFSSYLPLTAINTISVFLVFYFGRMYHQRRAISRIDLLWNIVQNVSIGTIGAIAFETLAFTNTGLDFEYPRGVILYTWLYSIVLIYAGREIHRQFVFRLQKSNIGRDNVLVVGDGEVAKSIIKHIRTNPSLGYHLVGAVTPLGKGRVAKTEVIGITEDLPYLIDTHAVDQVIIAVPEATRHDLTHLAGLCQRGEVDIRIYPDAFAFIAGTITVDDLIGIPLLSVRDISLRGWKLSLKRLIDFFGAGMGLIFFSPILLLLSFLVWWYDRGPVFFVQERVGLDGRPFPVIKFRTMIVDAEKQAKWTTANDSRVTPIGKFMRSNNLDELPQLVNVLFGQMSLVGPRPEQISFVQEFRAKYPRYSERHREKAGMTGWAQVNGLRGDTPISERLRADLYYVENWSLWLDIKIIIRTIWQTLTGRSPNAY